jgi:hypothetical protein
MGVVHSSEEYHEWLLDQLVCDVKLEHCKVCLLWTELAFEIDVIVRLGEEETLLSFLGDCNLNVKSLWWVDGWVSFRLLDQYFEAAFFSGSESNNVVSIVIGHKEICDVEVARDELLVVMDVIQEGGVVCQRTLLLEDVVEILSQRILAVIDLRSSSLIILPEHETFTAFGLDWGNTVRVLHLWVSALFTERPSMFLVTEAVFSPVLPKPVAVRILRAFLWFAVNCCASGVFALLDLNSLCFKAIFTPITSLTRVWERANALTVLELRLRVPVAHLDWAWLLSCGKTVLILW